MESWVILLLFFYIYQLYENVITRNNRFSGGMDKTLSKSMG